MEYRRLHFSRKHAIIAFLSRQCDGLTNTCRHGLVKGMRRRGGLAFLPGFLASSETKETRFLQSLKLQGKVIYDVVAFQGLLTLFFARQAKQAIAYEPNPPSYSRAAEHVTLNGFTNVVIHNLAVGSEPATLSLTFDPLMPGAASGDRVVRGQIEETARHIQSASVRVVRLDDDIRDTGLPAPDFIKIDSRRHGAERSARCHGVLQSHPELYLELHGSDLEINKPMPGPCSISFGPMATGESWTSRRAS